MKKFKLRDLLFCALLAAMGAVFSAFLSIEIPSGAGKLVEISLTPVVVILAGVLFGPLLGGMVGFVADFAGFFMGAQHGAYNPFFSITMALFGVIAGLIYLKENKFNWWKTVLVVIVSQGLISVLFNTLFIYYFYSLPMPFSTFLLARAAAALVEVPVYIFLLFVLIPVMLKIKSSRVRT